MHFAKFILQYSALHCYTDCSLFRLNCWFLFPVHMCLAHILLFTCIRILSCTLPRKIFSVSFTSHGSFLQKNPAVHSFKEGFFIFHPYFPFWLHPSFSLIYEISLHDSFIQCGASMFHVNIVRIQLKKKKSLPSSFLFLWIITFLSSPLRNIWIWHRIYPMSKILAARFLSLLSAFLVFTDLRTVSCRNHCF